MNRLMQQRLLLFDIDCTLLDTGGAGMAALRRAARRCFLESGRVPSDCGELPELDLAGSTDLGIVRGMFEHFGIAATPAAVSEFYEAYLECLGQHLVSDAFTGRLLPGVAELLDVLRDEARSVVGLLTGNIARGARLKIERFRIGHHFLFGAYGDDHHDRNLLGPIALERAAATVGRRFLGDECVVIGDTPKDVRCGRAFGARTVAVATGRFSADELAACGPDAVLGDLADVEAVLRALHA